MKCAICGIEIDSVDEGIDDGWIPMFGRVIMSRKGHSVHHVLKP